MRIRSAARKLLWLTSIALVGLSAAASAKGEGEPKKAAEEKAAPTKPGEKGSEKKSDAAARAPAKATGKGVGKAAVKAATPKKGAAARAAPKKGAPKRTRKPGEPGEPDETTRRIISGTAAPQGGSVRESPELRSMRDMDLTLFPGAAPSAGPAWPADGTVLLDAGEPRLDASGLPPSGLLPVAGSVEAARDISWLRQLNMPDIPVRWDGRVVRYLEYYKDDPRGRSAITLWIKKSGRYGAAIRRVLREQGLPEDLVWLALIESGFDPTVQSHAGAAGLWQFMPEGARIYGLTVDRWVDERLDPERATMAAARYLADLRQRFGGWELAMAAYNMGYGGLLASIRKYNTNDFWELSRLEAGMPLETALYVPKILSIAIVARNKRVFGCEDVELDPAVTFDKVAVGSGVSLHAVAVASGVGSAEIEALNPQLVARRTPPLPLGSKDLQRFEVRVPAGAGPRAAKSIPKVLEGEPKLERYLVRWGESLDDIAAFRGVTRSSLQSLNGLRVGEAPRPGALLFVPAAAGTGAAAAENLLAEGSSARPLIVVPAQHFSYADRRRVFYRVIPGDTLRDVADALGTDVDDLCRWNVVDPSATLHEGMTLQAFLPAVQHPPGVFLLEEADARVLEVGSDEFFTYFEGLKGRRRLEVVAKEGESFAKLARRYGLSTGMLERINHRSRTTPLRPGDRVVIYVPVSSFAEPGEPAREPDVAVAAASADDDGVEGTANAEPRSMAKSASVHTIVADDSTDASIEGPLAKSGAISAGGEPAPKAELTPVAVEPAPNGAGPALKGVEPAPKDVEAPTSYRSKPALPAAKPAPTGVNLAPLTAKPVHATRSEPR